MGSMGKLLGMLPGAGAMKKQIENFDESEITRTKAIVQSMTPLERRDLKVLNGSRRARIALGSGRKVSEVNALADKFTAAQKMMKQMRNGGGMPQMNGARGMALPPGMPGCRQLPRKRRRFRRRSRSQEIPLNERWKRADFRIGSVTGKISHLLQGPLPR